ncbi:hypothetical protein ONZ45_g16720 [Pleurotus djamor]|nr:hypothetical protein ONZ45_g16720 [Pleurotus djamor]
MKWFRVEGSDVKWADLENGTGEATVEFGDKLKMYFTVRVAVGEEAATVVARRHLPVKGLNPPIPPAIYRVGDGPLPALADGIVGMRLGGRREIYIPSELAFGETGLAKSAELFGVNEGNYAEAEYGDIPPNANLSIRVKVCKID